MSRLDVLGRGEPALPRWGIEPQLNEPAHRFFQRLAALNDQLSARVLATSLGLDGVNPKPSELLAFCVSLPIPHPERLVAATPVVRGARVTVAGQTFRKGRDWSLDRMRHCDACLAEGLFGRNWWDLVVLSRCPYHDRPLVSREGQSVTAWWNPHLDQFTDGTPTVRHGGARTDPPPPSWEAYVLGRMGIAPRLCVPLLDAVESMIEVIEAVELVGRAAVHGFRRETPGVPSRGWRRERVTMAGFAVFLEGSAALRRTLEAVADQAPFGEVQDGITWGVDRLFGWLPQGLREARESPATRLLAETLDGIAARRGVFCRKGSRAKGGRSERALTLYELAAELGIKPHRLREIAAGLGLTRMRKDRTRNHAFTPTAVAEIRAALDELVDRAEAAELVGLGRREFDAAAARAGLTPLCRLGGAGLRYDRFRRSVLQAWVDAILHGLPHVSNRHSGGVPIGTYCPQARMAVAEVLMAVSTGDIIPVGRREGEQGFQSLVLPAPADDRDLAWRPRARPVRPGMTFTDAAARIGVPSYMVITLVEAGHLSLVDPTLSGTRRPRVEEGSVVRFASTYAPATLYAEALGCGLSRAWPHLRALGLTPLVEPTRHFPALVRRAAARQALGLWEEPNASSAADLFWQALGRHLAVTRSVFRPASRLRGMTGRFNTGDRRTFVSVHLDLRARSLTVEVVCDPAKAGRRHAAVLDRIAGLPLSWPGLTISRDEATGIIRLADVLSPARLAQAETGPDLFTWIDERFERFRAVFSPRRGLTTPDGQSWHAAAAE